MICVCAHSVMSDSVTPRTVAHQAPLRMEFFRQEYWIVCHFLLQGIFPAQGSNTHVFVSCIGRWTFYQWRHLGSQYLHYKHYTISDEKTEA